MARVSVVTGAEFPELGAHVAVIQPDAGLVDGALGRMVAALDSGAGPGYDVVTADHLVEDADGVVRRAFAPDFSPERLRHQAYTGPVVAVRDEVARAAFDGVDLTSCHDAALRLAEVSHRWCRLPEAVATSTTEATAVDRDAIAGHVRRTGIDADVVPGDLPGVARVVRRTDVERLVSVVIPTQGSDGVVFGAQRTFVVEAIRSLVERSTYRALEFVVVADSATPTHVTAELREIAGDALVLVEYTKPFDFSDKVDVGVEASSGDLILLLNDDTELLAPDSVTTLVAHLDDPAVAMVGAKLLFEDGRLQHGGHVYHGDIHHACFGWPGESPGPAPLFPLAVARECSGVTAGCALVRRSAFEEVGGFDTALPHNYNDVDFSLKLRAAGHRIVWTPWSTWYHFESRTRVPDIREEERALIDARWHDALRNDPYYHPDLPPGPADWQPAPVPPESPTRSVVARARAFVGRTLLRRRVRRPAGVNLIGYLGATSGLGDRAREFEHVLDAAGIRYSRWDLDLTESARAAVGGSTPRPDDDVIFDTTVAVVTALAFPALDDVYPPLVREVDRVVGYWFWELADIPDSHRAAIDIVDEIWAPTSFVRDAYAAAVDIPVELVPLPIPPPQPSTRDRASFGFGDEFVFLTSFDHLSSMQRKHPLGVIEAFHRAFPDRGDVRLVVKSINGHARPDQSAALAAAAHDDRRIDVRDGYLTAGDHAALLAAADCYVSLHRSEGLGLHIAEAMWLGTPVIATDYSGSVDLTTPVDGEPVAELVPYRLVPVEHGGEAYTAGEWADPDLDAAAAAMRRLHDDPDRREALTLSAHRHIAHSAELGPLAASVGSHLVRPAPRTLRKRS